MSNRIQYRAQRAWQAIAPRSRAWRGATWGLLGFIVILLLVTAYAAFAPGGPVRFAIGAVLYTTAIAATGALIVGVAWLLGKLPAFYGWLVACGLVLIALVLMRGLSVLPGVLLVGMVGMVALSLLGAAVAILLRPGWRRATTTQRIVAVAGLLLGAIAVGLGGPWLLWTGAPLTLPVDAAAQTSAPVPPLDAPNPAQPGPQTVAFLCYGQGGDRWSDTCAADVELVTEPVDGSALVAGWSALRTAYWGFGPQAMPRNGRVWYPTGDGPFPLVLMVHGAADMEKPSDAGYGYLGELLASRGFIAVSVDQNFLNFSQFADLLFFNTLEEENDARAWLLLEHLAQWRTWNEQPGNPFHGKVDMGKIALIGHSRGGEAVAIAAAFNQLPVYPDDATLTFDYGFDIRAVAAIAPTDGFYTPANVGTPLRNVNYFVLQGAHDMDVATFMGARQYARAEFAPGEPRQFKAALYVFGANHGQFNTVWGRKDVDEPAARLFNLRQLLLAAEQQQIAQVYIAAFLETTLRDEPAYLPLFQDHRHAGDWLPETIYLNQYADSFTRWISTYEEDIDLASATLPGGSQAGRNLTIWREQIVPGRWQTMENKAVYLGWDASTNSEAAAYTIRLPEQGLDVNVGSTLVFDLAAAREHPDPDADDAAASEEIPSEPIDLTVAVLDQEGNTARLPLSHFAPLQPPLEAQVTKAEFLYVLPTSEAVFQSFAFPLAAFTEVNPAFTPAELAELRLVFDRTPRGVIILDNVGVRRSG